MLVESYKSLNTPFLPSAADVVFAAEWAGVGVEFEARAGRVFEIPLPGLGVRF